MPPFLRYFITLSLAFLLHWYFFAEPPFSASLFRHFLHFIIYWYRHSLPLFCRLLLIFMPAFMLSSAFRASWVTLPPDFRALFRRWLTLYFRISAEFHYMPLSAGFIITLAIDMPASYFHAISFIFHFRRCRYWCHEAISIFHYFRCRRHFRWAPLFSHYYIYIFIDIAISFLRFHATLFAMMILSISIFHFHFHYH